MKAVLKLLILTLATSISTTAQEKTKEYTEFTGPYFGQQAPVNKPVPFATEFFGESFIFYHSSICFSPDGKEAYWQATLNDSTRNQGIFYSKLENGFWTVPQVASFSICSSKGIDDSPFIPPDGERLFFISTRPTESSIDRANENIWVVERTSEGWSNPKYLPFILNSTDEEIHWRLSVDKQNNLYFGTWQGEKGTPKAIGTIYVSRYEDGQYCKPEKLPPTINLKGTYNFCPQIAPDGSYLIFNRDALYCSFKNEDGTWSEAINIDLIEWEGSFVPSISPDGRFLFLIRFVKDGSRLYWIDLNFIENLRNKENSCTDLQ